MIIWLDQASDLCRAASLCEARVAAGSLGKVARGLGDIAETHALEMLGLGHLDTGPGNAECHQRPECGDDGQYSPLRDFRKYLLELPDNVVVDPSVL